MPKKLKYRSFHFITYQIIRLKTFISDNLQVCSGMRLKTVQPSVLNLPRIQFTSSGSSARGDGMVKNVTVVWAFSFYHSSHHKWVFDKHVVFMQFKASSVVRKLESLLLNILN